MIEMLKEYDPLFNTDEFLSKVGNIYVMLCTSLMFENLDRVKHFISDDVFNKYLNILEHLQSNNERQIFDELCVASSRIEKIMIDNNQITIKVILVSQYLDCVIDKTSSKLKRGNDYSRVDKYNYLTFVKRVGAKEQGMARTCPSCGANVDVNSNGKCEYCGSFYNNDDFDYILEDIKIA